MQQLPCSLGITAPVMTAVPPIQIDPMGTARVTAMIEMSGCATGTPTKRAVAARTLITSSVAEAGSPSWERAKREASSGFPLRFLLVATFLPIVPAVVPAAAPAVFIMGARRVAAVVAIPV